MSRRRRLSGSHAGCPGSLEFCYEGSQVTVQPASPHYMLFFSNRVAIPWQAYFRLACATPRI